MPGVISVARNGCRLPASCQICDAGSFYAIVRKAPGSYTITHLVGDPDALVNELHVDLGLDEILLAVKGSSGE